MGFDGAEATGELLRGGAQGTLGVEVEVAGEVDEGEEHVAIFFLDGCGVAGADGGAKLGNLLVQLCVRAGGILPIETDLGGLMLGALSLEQGGEGGGHAVEGGGFGGLVLGLLDALPVAEHGLGVFGVHFAEDVRVAADELVGQGGGHVVEGELAAVLPDVRLEEHLQEHVTQLLAVVLQIVAHHGREQLVALLLQAGLDAGERLLTVPRAAVGRTQRLEHPA